MIYSHLFFFELNKEIKVWEVVSFSQCCHGDYIISPKLASAAFVKLG